MNSVLVRMPDEAAVPGQSGPGDVRNVENVELNPYYRELCVNLNESEQVT